MAGFRLEPEPGSAGKAELMGGPRLSAREGEGRVETGRRGIWAGKANWAGGEKKNKRKGREGFGPGWKG